MEWIMTFHILYWIIGNFIIPTDALHFSEGVGIPTTDQLRRWGSSLHFQKFVAADEQIDLEKFVGRY